MVFLLLFLERWSSVFLLQQKNVWYEQVEQHNQSHCYQYGDEHDIGNLTFRKGAEVGDEGSCIDNHDAAQLLAVLRLKDDEYQTQHIHEDE